MDNFTDGQKDKRVPVDGRRDREMPRCHHISAEKQANCHCFLHKKSITMRMDAKN